MSIWNSYVLFDSKESITSFWEEYYTKKQNARILVIIGKGFDPRMNNFLKLILEIRPKIVIDCLTFNFPALVATDGDTLYDINTKELTELQKEFYFGLEEIVIDTSKTWEKRIVGMHKAMRQKDFSLYTDIILDVSSLPRAIYFNVAKILYGQIDKSKINLFFAVSENVEIDSNIVKEHNEEDIYPLVGFRSMLEVEAYLDRKNILIPLIGEKREKILEKIYNSFKPSDVCPVLPFPSKDPRRSDKLLLEYNSFLKDRLYIEPQSLTYAHERNPFELYRILNRLIENYQRTLSPISDNICFGIALLTSKLLSLGALLIGLEHNDCIAIYNVSTTSYKITDKKKIVEANTKSEPFLLWITGDAYNE